MEEVWQILNLLNPEVGRKQSENNVSELTKDLKPVIGQLALGSTSYLEGVNNSSENNIEEEMKVKSKIKEGSKEEVERITKLKVPVKENQSQNPVCNKCGFETLSLKTLATHKFRKHGKGLKTKKQKLRAKKIVKCEECDKIWTGGHTNYVEIKNHKREHTINNFTCECPDQTKVCNFPDTFGFTSKDKISLLKKENHMKVVHMGWKPCTENGCRSSFEIDVKLAAHVKTHDIICDDCGWKGMQLATLLNHRARVHDQVKAQCQECGEMQKNKHSLKSHIRREHTRVVCIICTATVKNIRIHMTNQHMETSEMRYQCDRCKKGFMDKFKLDNHMMSVHIKLRPHQCRYGCANRYNDVSNRNAHEKRRHGKLFESSIKNKYC